MYDYAPEAYLGWTGMVRRRATPQELGEAMIKAIADQELERRDPPLVHYFAKGLYGRRMFCDAGTTVVSMAHKVQHITVVMKGICYVAGVDGSRLRIEAPDVWITEPGTQRAIYCETDVEWMTVHANPDDIPDIEILESVLVEDPLLQQKTLFLGDAPKRIKP
jgi:quercetin dioxygenase-like cupin family protein